MKYRLKDEALHQKMRSLYDNFDERLETSCDWQMTDGMDYVCVDELYRIDSASDVVHFAKDEIICSPGGFDPTSWNAYPSVTPPEGIMMRIEEWDGTCCAGAFVGGSWHIDGRDRLGEVKRFRLWVD